jgi:LacI family transcriptional regulator
VTTIRDVALEAGVSVATVSRALNNNAKVDAGLAQRVRAAAAKLNYQPNAIARNLRQQRTSVWALIISDIGNPFFTAVARGVEDVAQENGYSVLLCNADETPEKEDQYLRVAEQEQAAGVILSPHSGRTNIDRFASSAIPLVAIDRRVAGAVDTVLVNSREGARSATEHLISQGWKRPGCLTGPAEAITAVEREKGYRDAMRDGSLSDQAIVARDAFTVEGGKRAAAELLDREDPPDALFIANSSLALGALAVLRERGIKVGTDIGLIAFDDAPWAPFLDPPISVVAQPAYEIGREAARLLRERISKAAPSAAREIVLSTELVLRRSSLKPKA